MKQVPIVLLLSVAKKAYDEPPNDFVEFSKVLDYPFVPRLNEIWVEKAPKDLELKARVNEVSHVKGEFVKVSLLNYDWRLIEHLPSMGWSEVPKL